MTEAEVFADFVQKRMRGLEPKPDLATDGPRTRYILGPFEEPSEPKALMSIENAIEDLRTRFACPDHSHGEEMVYRIVELTDAEVETLQEL